MHTTSHVLMIRPVHFTYNVQTAVNNSFQVKKENAYPQQHALKEFDDFVAVLQANGVDVLVISDSPQPHTPDSIFPNNWVSFHANGTVVLYPMFALNRRQERKPTVLEAIKKQFRVKHITDLSKFEEQGKFLEGTGSIVPDRDKNIAYACLSPRTDEALFYEFCSEMHYHAVPFHATDAQGVPIYHTNVMMCVTDPYVVICLDTIKDREEKRRVEQTIRNSGREPFPISIDQMNHFAGNMLQLHNEKAEKLLVMSTQAYQSLTSAQIKMLESFNTILHSPLTSIETNGGGSARCMIAEIHLPKYLV